MITKKMEITKQRSENTKNLVVSAKMSKHLVLLASLGLFLVGCGRCQECSYDAGGSETICETEFDSPAQYEQALDNAEANGAECTASSSI